MDTNEYERIINKYENEINKLNEKLDEKYIRYSQLFFNHTTEKFIASYKHIETNEYFDFEHFIDQYIDLFNHIHESVNISIEESMKNYFIIIS